MYIDSRLRLHCLPQVLRTQGRYGTLDNCFRESRGVQYKHRSITKAILRCQLQQAEWSFFQVKVRVNGLQFSAAAVEMNDLATMVGRERG